MKTKLCFCKSCNKKTIHYVENEDKAYSWVIGLCTAGLVIPRDLCYTCSICGNEFVNKDDIICGIL